MDDSSSAAEAVQPSAEGEPGETTYVIPALPAGTYKYQCSVHPSVPNMNGTLTVK